MWLEKLVGYGVWQIILGLREHCKTIDVDPLSPCVHASVLICQEPRPKKNRIQSLIAFVDGATHVLVIVVTISLFIIE